MNLSIQDLTKTYPNGVKALDQVNLEIGPGMFGLLGPNGAGKSTLMRTIATLQQPNSGTIKFGDIDVLANPIALRRILGYLPQEFGVYPKLSAQELLQYFARLKGISSALEREKIIKRALEVTNLWDVRQKSVSQYSGGMKQRFGIAQLLLNDPKLIIVDEPTAGLDPAERHRFLNVLREIGTNHTVIFSTHIVDDVRELCHAVGILNGGNIQVQGTLTAATSQLDNKIWQCITTPDQLQECGRKYEVISSNYNQDNTLNIRIYSETIPDDRFVKVQAQLEDVYFVALKKDQQYV